MKIHIDIRDDIDPEDAVRRVAYVISEGKISTCKGKPIYCGLTTWKDGIAVGTNLYRKSDCFVVWKQKKFNF